MQRAEKSIRVAAPASAVYGFWRDFENLPQFMENVKEVHRVGAGQEVLESRVREDVEAEPLGMKSTLED